MPSPCESHELIQEDLSLAEEKEQVNSLPWLFLSSYERPIIRRHIHFHTIFLHATNNAILFGYLLLFAINNVSTTRGNTSAVISSQTHIIWQLDNENIYYIQYSWLWPQTHGSPIITQHASECMYALYTYHTVGACTFSVDLNAPEDVWPISKVLLPISSCRHGLQHVSIHL